jgi:parallel beta-helix repeat protein
MRKLSTFTLVLCLYIGLTALSANAQEYIHGQLSGTLGPGTYIVDGDIQVIEGDVLTINPGTTLQHAGHFTWLIQGEFNVMGTSEDIVRFTRQQPIENHLWGGIRFDNSLSPNSELQWCVLEACFNIVYPEYRGGAIFIDSTSVRISNCAILNCVATEGGGIFARYTNSLIVDNCLFSNNISEDGGGIFLYECDGVQITKCIFNGNTSTST